MRESSIKARGTRGGRKHEIVIKKDGRGKIKAFLDGREDSFLLERLDRETEFDPSLANNYQPERGTMLAYYNLLATTFFDELDGIETAGDIGTIPYSPEKGILY